MKMMVDESILLLKENEGGWYDVVWLLIVVLKVLF